MAITIAIMNQKGGVGKTSVCFNLASALSKMGKKVLLVDNDPQANLSSYACAQIDESLKSIDEYYLEKNIQDLRMEDLSIVNRNLYLLSSDQHLSGVEYYLMSRNQRDQILKQVLKSVQSHFDFIFIDNPPSLNLLSMNALMASDYILVPVLADYFSLEGLSQVIASYKDIRRWNPNLKLLGCIANMMDDRKKMHKEILAMIEEEYPKFLFQTKIPVSVKFAEGASFNKSILDMAAKSVAGSAYIQFANEVISRCQKNESAVIL